jgi:hypothetical protein
MTLRSYILLAAVTSKWPQSLLVGCVFRHNAPQPAKVNLPKSESWNGLRRFYEMVSRWKGPYVVCVIVQSSALTSCLQRMFLAGITCFKIWLASYHPGVWGNWTRIAAESLSEAEGKMRGEIMSGSLYHPLPLATRDEWAFLLDPISIGCKLMAFIPAFAPERHVFLVANFPP